MTPKVEIGEARDLKVRAQSYRLHIPGEPLRLARLAAQLMKVHKSQPKVADLMGISQASVSRFLLLLNLPEAIQRKLDTGAISFSTACVLAAMPPEAWKHLAKKDRITRKEAEAAARKVAVTEELLDALEAPEPNGRAKKCPTCGRPR